MPVIRDQGLMPIEVTVLPSRAAYLIHAGSRSGLRRAVQEASTRWGGMTEPIVPVRKGGTLGGWWRQVIGLSRVDAVVNVDVPREDAWVAAELVGLPLVDLADIDGRGPAGWTSHPINVGEPRPVPIIATRGGHLWEAVLAGDLTPEHAADLQTAQIPFQRPRTTDEIARAALRGATMLDLSLREFGEHWAQGIGGLPAIIWVTRNDGYADCIWFWNLRALRPLRLDTVPMMLLPAENIGDWVDFGDQIHGYLARPEGFSPDVVIGSTKIPESGLAEIARLLGLVESTEPPRTGVHFPTELRTPPFTYLTAHRLDVRQFMYFERRYGLTTHAEVYVTAHEGTLRFPSPVRFGGGGRALVRLRTPDFDALPKRPALARQVIDNAIWRGDELQIHTDAVREYGFKLRIPTLEDAVDSVLRERTTSYGLSDKGRLGAVMMAAAQSWLAKGTYEAAVELTTPRSKELLRELKRVDSDQASEAALIELASRWGGRAERRYRTARELERAHVDGATEATELLCAHGWAERGLALRCDRCGIPSFVPVAQTQRSAVCPGCGATGRYSTESSGLGLYYRLDSLVDRASDQGVLPHLLAVAALIRLDDRTRLLPGVDVTFSDGSSGEVDLAGVHAGKVIAGEVETKSREFTEAQIARDIATSQRLGADVHVMATVETFAAATRSLAQHSAAAAGLELLILDRSSLRPE